MSAEADRKRALEALTRAAAGSMGPIASLLVEEAAAGGAPVQDVRRKVAAQIDAAARPAFLAATATLAAASDSAVSAAPVSQPPAVAPSGPATVDRSDPQLVQALAQELAKHSGAAGDALVREAARRCRTKTQLYLRLAAAVTDPDLKAVLMHRAATDLASRGNAG